jgi:hypothetical protein
MAAFELVEAQPATLLGRWRGREFLVRGDSAYGNHQLVCACVNAGVRFSVVLNRTARSPGRWPAISDAEIAEVAFTAFASTRHPVTARLVVRRTRDLPAPCPPLSRGTAPETTVEKLDRPAGHCASVTGHVVDGVGSQGFLWAGMMRASWNCLPCLFAVDR